MDYPYVFLLTAPRFLNYKFSPASFWYLYDDRKRLKYIITEVNNTFDERHIYLLPASDSPLKFSHTFAKDFHVSPFISRRGSYNVTSNDPSKGEDINVAVTLSSSMGHVKLIARWTSATNVLDVSSLGRLPAVWIICCWAWTVLLTCEYQQSELCVNLLIRIISSQNRVASAGFSSGPQTQYLVPS